jgi:UDP-N-acetylmuramoylalanine--D-glutamate ligase
MKMLDLKGRKVVVLGLGDTGLSMARWLVKRGADVRVADSRAAPPHAGRLAREVPNVELACGPFTDETLQGAELIALSPGIDRREAPIAKAIARGVPMAGDVELFAQALDSLDTRHSTASSDEATQASDSAGSAARRAAGGQIPAVERGPSSAPRRAPPQVVAITGSNGKSTVTAMAGAMCRAAGRETVVAGNIGVPVLDALAAIEAGAKVPQVFVLELSSFQLESTASLAPDAAAMLNLTEDHMDRYDGLADYAAAKARVFHGKGVQVLNRDDRWSMGMARAGRTILTFAREAPRAENEWGIAGSSSSPWLMHGVKRLVAAQALPVKGLHNAANALAAHALCHALGLPDEPTAAALETFTGLPHRLQKVGEVEGVAFYDDSKGTNVGATVAALTGMDQTVALIAGGEGKDQDFSPLAAAVAGRARAVVLIGRDAGLIALALDRSGVRIENAKDMEEAVRIAYSAVRPGDAVLLSPACASFDMFRDYAHRGEMFVAAVRRLESQEFSRLESDKLLRQNRPDESGRKK